ncbi:GtrA family protein [Vibrio sp. D420a]|uniref:GtrA family protein n=1 Tax=Vibrio sp. D420a TaxID=2836895 RepID=UPI0025557300|nr:GtrA family protein [Vibrio sp. D420a]MDK9764496.1 GtrA family protein [Vibrio sp. D420a]
MKMPFHFRTMTSSIERVLRSHHQLIKFACVGAGGFVVDCVAFALFHFVGDLSVMWARVLAFLVAATSTWIGNRVLTFEYQGTGSRRDDFKQWQKFMTSAMISAVPNLICFMALILILPEFYGSLFLAMAVGVLVGMVSNYLLSKAWVFKQTQA